MRRMSFLVWKELIELKEDPRLFVIVVAAPLLQLVMLGYAATTDVRHVPIVVADGDRSASSRDLIARFAASPNFTLIDVVSSPGDIDPYLERGRAWMALDIPPQYGRRLERRESQSLQLVADGSDASSTNVALGYATNLIAAYAQELVEAGRQGAAGRIDGPGAAGGDDRAGGSEGLRAEGASTGVAEARPTGERAEARGIDARVRVWFNPRLESRDFMLPGILALLLLVVTTNLSSMGIVREKEVGTLEQLNVTPLRRWELIVGKLLPYALVGLIDACLVVAVTLFWFQIPLRGSVALLFALTALYLLSTLGLGLFVSTISSTQQQAMMTTMFFFLMPMVFLSGFVFPIENMPAVIQPLTYLLPLRYFLVILRSIFLKGVGLETLWPQAAAVTAWGVAVLALAIARSTKRMV
jgi:ABC-2 type transport system permease protein